MTEPRVVTVATRRSALALAQCRAWIRELCARHVGLRVEELHVVTSGDRIVDRALSEVGGKGLFVKEIEEAIADGRATLAVHSMKDVPPALAPGLELSCVPKREDPRDVAVTRDGCPLSELATGARVGTSSLRRSVQLAVWRPDLRIVPLRGNVDTRLRKCRAGEVDAVILARAGLLRLGLEHEVTEVLDPELCLPAVGQGALAVEQRSDDAETRALVEPLTDPESSLCVAAERGVMAAVEGNCQTPVAAYAERVARALRLRALLAEPDGSRLRRREATSGWPANREEAHRMGFELGLSLKAG